MTRTDTASRVIAVPPDRVYATLVDPEALVTWLPLDGMSGRFERFDARPGRSYRLVLTYANASAARGKATADSDLVDARFVDLVPGVRVVQAVDFVSDDPANADHDHDLGARRGRRRDARGHPRRRRSRRHLRGRSRRRTRLLTRQPCRAPRAVAEPATTQERVSRPKPSRLLVLATGRAPGDRGHGPARRRTQGCPRRALSAGV